MTVIVTTLSPTGPTVAAGMLRGLMEFIIGRGAHRAALEERCGIGLDALQDQDLRVPFCTYETIMRAGKELLVDPALALHYGETADMATESIVGLVTRSSASPLDAIERMNRYGRLLVETDCAGNGDRFALVRANGQVWLTDQRRNPNVFPELTESSFARILAAGRKLGNVPFVLAVHVTHPEPAYRAEYDRIFRAPVCFNSDRNALLLDPAWLTQPITIEPRYLSDIVTAHAEKLLENLKSANSARGQVERLLLPILHTGRVRADRIAGLMGFTRQTLHRKLTAEGVSFEEVLDELRSSMARHYLSGKQASVKQTAHLVGFSDPAAFSRAFKRWTGHPPVLALRAALQSSKGDAA